MAENAFLNTRRKFAIHPPLPNVHKDQIYKNYGLLDVMTKLRLWFYKQICNFHIKQFNNELANTPAVEIHVLHDKIKLWKALIAILYGKVFKKFEKFSEWCIKFKITQNMWKISINLICFYLFSAYQSNNWEKVIHARLTQRLYLVMRDKELQLIGFFCTFYLCDHAINNIICEYKDRKI